MKNTLTVYQFHVFKHGGNYFEIVSIDDPSKDCKSKIERYNLPAGELHRKFELFQKALGDPDCRISIDGCIVLTWRRDFSNQEAVNV